MNVEKRKVISLYGIEYRGKTIWKAEQLDGNDQYNVGYEGVDSIATFELSTYGNKIYVNNISYAGNVKKGTIYYAQDSSRNKDWKVAKLNTTESSYTIEVLTDGTFWVKIKDSAGNESQEKSIYVKDVIGKRASAVLKTDKDATDPAKKSPYVEYDGN